MEPENRYTRANSLAENSFVGNAKTSLRYYIKLNALIKSDVTVLYQKFNGHTAGVSNVQLTQRNDQLQDDIIKLDDIGQTQMGNENR